MEEQLKNILFDPTIGKIIAVIAGIIILVVISKFVKRILKKRVKESDSRYKANKVVTFISYILAVLFVSVVFSDKLGGLTVALGVAGAGIAFALQEVIASVAGWLAIAFAGFYKTGDRVQLGNIKGDVIDIGVLRTTLMETGQWVDGDLYNGRLVRIANSAVFKDPVFNYSGDFPFLWDEIKVPVKYGSDYELARKIISDAGNVVVSEYPEKAKKYWDEMLKNYLLENSSLDTMVTLTANDNWVEFTLRYVVNFKKRRITKDNIFTIILKEFEKTEGKVGFASATFHLVEMPEIKVNLNK
ncbi:MAG: mechanosensitive ion channel family protein [Ignavibacteria bacterium]|nr:mechanosensitive ion channel family protein [Ignavibacteria bacterium]